MPALQAFIGPGPFVNILPAILGSLAKTAIVTAPAWFTSMVLCLTGKIKTKRCQKHKRKKRGKKKGKKKCKGSKHGIPRRDDGLHAASVNAKTKAALMGLQLAESGTSTIPADAANLGALSQENKYIAAAPHNVFPGFYDRLVEWTAVNHQTWNSPLFVAVQYPAKSDEGVALYSVDPSATTDDTPGASMDGPSKESSDVERYEEMFERALEGLELNTYDNLSESGSEDESDKEEDIAESALDMDVDVAELDNDAPRRPLVLEVSAESTMDADTFRNATILAQRVGGLAVTFEEIVGGGADA